MDTNEYEAPKAERIPFLYRIRYLFSSYRMRNFFHKAGKKVLICLLMILLLIPLCYISLHPANKIKLNYFLTRNCTIRVNTRVLSPLSGFSSSFFTIPVDTVIRIDGDWVEVIDRETDYYYLAEDGKIHHYSRNVYGEWIKTIYNSDPEDEELSLELLDKSNYTRSKENFFVWLLHWDIDKRVDGMSDTRMQRANGSLAIVGTFFVDGIECEKTIRFTKFGRTKIEIPWEELENATLYTPPQSK